MKKTAPEDDSGAVAVSVDRRLIQAAKDCAEPTSTA